MKAVRSIRNAVATLGAIFAVGAAQANPVPWQLNLTPGVTTVSREIYDLHNLTMIICTVIGVIIIAAMIWSIFHHRKSKGAVAANFTHNTTAEVIWTVVPILLLIVMAVPATKTLFKMYDTTDSAMTVKINGAQWLWRYEYQGQGVQFTSRLARDSDRTRTLDSGLDPAKVVDKGENVYLLDVDHPLVLPIDTKIRFVVTSDDVIHSWWVPQFGWKQDANPGLIGENWTRIDKPGIYRGQCTELCGRDHGFMPIVVKAVSKAEFQTWLAQEKAAEAAANMAQAGGTAAAAAPAVATAP
ncbi:MAG: cytochrome c oxidase subunit II [Proteobacteria bacterium]|nr:cytochrome c oxidase subunit II [Pseudomonadota bacterium]MBS0463945.1 cytochrome c oxidase subunit II [Pseudomonadota bacterium]